MVKAVLFDLDGTLLDTAPDFSFVLDTMMARRQRPPVPYEKVHQTVSDGARGMIAMAFGATPEHPEFEALRQELLALYTDHIADNTLGGCVVNDAGSGVNKRVEDNF